MGRTLGESEKHVEVCNFVLEKCSLGCGKVLRRDQMSLHESDKCINRNMEVECELGCGMIVHRDDMTQHISLECGEKEIECPFVKYKCEVRMIKRRELDTHLEEKRSEHFELKVNAMEEIFIGQNKEIEMLKNEMEKMKKIEKCLINVDKKVIEQNTSLIETLLNRPDFSKLEWNIKNLPKEMRVPVEAHFQIDGYYFKLECIWGNRNALLLNFCPQNGWNYDTLKWPFRAEFIIRCELDISWYSTRYKNEFKTDVIAVKKEQYRPCTEITIASIYESKFSFDTIRYVDKISFEIYVIQ